MDDSSRLRRNECRVEENAYRRAKNHRVRAGDQIVAPQLGNIRELKKHLAELTKKELINEISFLFKMNSFSKDYLSSKFSPDLEHSILEKYKQQVKNEFYPQRGEPKLRLSIAKKAVSVLCDNYLVRTK